MDAVQTKNGKSFEYACLDSLYRALSPTQDVNIEETSQLEMARNSFLATSTGIRSKLVMAADAATRVVLNLEPQLEHPDANTPLFLSLQTDDQREESDVRDVVCMRKQNNWEIGLSCKNNHRDAKHNRLSATIDFAEEWFGIACSREYFDTVTPVFEELGAMREKSSGRALWSSIDNKSDRFYAPILRAFMDELHRLDRENPLVVPKGLIRSLVGSTDCYKVITDNTRSTTWIEAINIDGTLGRPANGVSNSSVPCQKMPTQIVSMDFRVNSNKHVEIAFDEGWSISAMMRCISTRITPALMLVLSFESFPSTRHILTEAW